MIVIGLTGSIAMGKSEVARICREQGLPVFDADKAVHALYDSAEGAALIAPHVPAAVINNKVDRAILSRHVLADRHLLEKLETDVHRAVGAKRDSFLAESRSQGCPIAVLDIPLLFEKNLDADVDLALLVSSRSDLQRARAMQRPGMTAEKFEMILARQMPDAEKRKRADIVIENNGTLDELREKVLSVLTGIQKARLT